MLWSAWRDPKEHDMKKLNNVKATEKTETIAKTESIANILEQELAPTIKEWLRRVNLVPELTRVPMSDKDRTGHLPMLFHDLICRLRLDKDAEAPISANAAAHGKLRVMQGYSASMLIEESRIFQVSTFGTLHLHQDRLDQKQVLLDVMTIADEVDAQLKETVRSFTGDQLSHAAA
jgi:hypothetical protein